MDQVNGCKSIGYPEIAIHLIQDSNFPPHKRDYITK